MGFGKTKYDEFDNYKPGGGSKDEWFKPEIPKSGENRYHGRILPPLEGEDYPIIDADLHYWNSWPGKAPEGVESGVSCAKDGHFDLASDIYWKLRKTFDPKSPQNSAVQALKPTTRVYANVIIKQTPNGKIPVEEQKPQTWSMSFKAGENLKSLFDDFREFSKLDPEQYAPIDDLERGRDVIIKVESGPPVKFTFSAYPGPSPVENVDEMAAQATPLQSAAYQRVLTEEQCREYVRPVLGEFYDEVMAAYVEAGGEAPGEATEVAAEALGEAV